MHVSARKMNDDAIIEMDVNGVTHRLLIREADELAFKLRETVMDAVSSNGGIFCSRCGRFLTVKKGRAGPQEAKCTCGYVERFYDRAYLPSDITTEFLIEPTESGKFTFTVFSRDPPEWGNRVTLSFEEFATLYMKLKEFVDSDNPKSIRLTPLHIFEKSFSLCDARKPNPSAKRYVLMQFMRDAAFRREFMPNEAFYMTHADLRALLNEMRNIIAQRNLHEQIESYMREQSDVQNGHKDE